MKDINFYKRYKETIPKVGKEKKKATVGDIVAKLVPLVVLIAVLMGAYVLMLMSVAADQRKLDETNAATTDPKLLADVAYSGELEKLSVAYIRARNEVEGVLFAKNSYPIVGSDLMRAIEYCNTRDMRVELKSYNADTGLLVFQSATPVVIDIPSYIYSLEDTGRFNEVKYIGYSYDESEGVYYIQAQCYLSAVGGA